MLKLKGRIYNEIFYILAQVQNYTVHPRSSFTNIRLLNRYGQFRIFRKRHFIFINVYKTNFETIVEKKDHKQNLTAVDISTFDTIFFKYAPLLD